MEILVFTRFEFRYGNAREYSFRKEAFHMFMQERKYPKAGATGSAQHRLHKLYDTIPSPFALYI